MPAERVGPLAAAMRRLIVDPELRRRLGKAGERNVRRFQTETVSRSRGALIRGPIAEAREAGAARAPEPAPAPVE